MEGRRYVTKTVKHRHKHQCAHVKKLITKGRGSIGGSQITLTKGNMSMVPLQTVKIILVIPGLC